VALGPQPAIRRNSTGGMRKLNTRKLEKTKEPGIYKRGNRYVVMYRDASGRQHKRAAGATIAEAKNVKAQLRADASRGEDTEVTREKFATYATRWIEHYAGRTARGVRDETRADYKRVLEADAIPFLGHLKLAQIRQAHLNEFAAHVASRGVAANTVKAALAPVKALLADALAAGDIRVNPAAGWRARYTQTVEVVDDDTAESDVKALDEDQLTALLTHVPDDWHLFYSFLAQTGLRISEAVELRWRDVDFGANSFKVSRRFYRGRVAPPKSKYGRRTVRLSPSLSRALWPLQGDADALVFTTAQGSRLDGSNLMTRVLKPAAVKAGMGEWVKTEKGRHAESWVGHHTFRHTCATMLFRHGWNAKQVQIFLGHHSPAFTLATYVHLLPSDLPEPPAIFDAWGNTGVTKPTETGRNDPATVAVDSAQDLVVARAV
jgi:integrase